LKIKRHQNTNFSEFVLKKKKKKKSKSFQTPFSKYILFEKKS